MRFIHPTSLAFGCGTNALRLRAHIHQELLGSILPGRLGACAAAGLGGGGAPFAAASTIGWLPGVKRIIRVDSPPRCASRFTARPLGAERLPVDRLRVAPQPAGGSRAGFPGQRRGGRGQADERLGLGPEAVCVGSRVAASRGRLRVGPGPSRLGPATLQRVRGRPSRRSAPVPPGPAGQHRCIGERDALSARPQDGDGGG